jgi:hypothetical protein
VILSILVKQVMLRVFTCGELERSIYFAEKTSLGKRHLVASSSII